MFISSLIIYLTNYLRLVKSTGHYFLAPLTNKDCYSNFDQTCRMYNGHAVRTTHHTRKELSQFLLSSRIENAGILVCNYAGEYILNGCDQVSQYNPPYSETAYVFCSYDSPDKKGKEVSNSSAMNGALLSTCLPMLLQNSLCTNTTTPSTSEEVNVLFCNDACGSNIIINPQTLVEPAPPTPPP